MRLPLTMLAFLLPASAFALQQPDGAPIPQASESPTVWEVFSWRGEPIDVVNDARTSPEIFFPTTAVTIENLAEGAGYESLFGWYNAGSPGQIHTIFECFEEPGARTTLDIRSDGRWAGGQVGFALITPEGAPGGNCGSQTNPGYTYYSEPALNNDGAGFIHHLIWDSRVVPNAYYFGFEDLYRGGDNDFNDVLVIVEGIVPDCVPVPEVCNGRDDDCNGAIDEVGTTCVDFATCGTYETCGACPPPPAEVCDGADNDCDGQVDEGAQVSCTDWASCQPVRGCGSCAPAPAETCNGRDDDCDGVVDDAASCPDGLLCSNGECATACPGGARPQPCLDYASCATVETCGGCAAPPQESCNGADDDCDGPIDEGASTSCSELLVCDGGSCVDPCQLVVCPRGERCEEGSCVDPCATAGCAEACRDGTCLAWCMEGSCPDGAICDAEDVCAPDGPCAQVSCAAGQVCDEGRCVDACAGVTCPGAQVCTGGRCEGDPCGGACGSGERCVGARCVSDGGGGGAGGQDADGDGRPDATSPGASGDAAELTGGSAEGGCGCGASGAPTSLPVLALAALLLLRRRRG